MLTMEEANALTVEMQALVAEELRPAVDWKQYTKKTNRYGKVHTMIFYRATETGGRVQEEITALLNIKVHEATDRQDIVAKAEAHPAKGTEDEGAFYNKGVGGANLRE